MIASSQHSNIRKVKLGDMAQFYPARNASLALFPLQRSFLYWGVVAGTVGGVMFQSVLAAFAFPVLFGCAGAVWRRGESFLAFCIAFQWLEIVGGYFYFLATGSRSDPLMRGNLPEAVFLSLIGLVAITCGLRFGIRILRPWSGPVWAKLQRLPIYNQRVLFGICIAAGAFSSFIAISPMAVWFTGAQLIGFVLKLPAVFLPVLLFEVVRTRRGVSYATIAVIVMWLPTLASHMSAFGGMFMTILIVLTSEWRPWEIQVFARLRSRQMLLWSVLTAIVLIGVAIFWIGGMKAEWRPRILRGEVAGKPIDKAFEFFATALRVAPRVDPGLASRDLAGRLASATDMFGLVVDRVPEVVDHANGELTWRALYHVTHPRILFPNKVVLGSDSPMVIKYAGIRAAGDEAGTSVGIGIMAQFFIDFGVPGMWVAAFLWGTIVGLLYEGVLWFAPSYDMYRAITIVVLDSFNGAGGDIAKNLGAVLQGWLVFAVVFLVAGRVLHSYLIRK